MENTELAKLLSAKADMGTVLKLIKTFLLTQTNPEIPLRPKETLQEILLFFQS